MNTFGHIFRLTTFGESHGTAIGGVIDGMPAGLAINTEEIDLEMERRRPGASALTSQRRESDRVHLLSGIFEGTSTGTPIAFTIDNTDARPQDYDRFRDVLRTGHADATYIYKYGIRDHRGGGRASARATAAVVAAGAIARQFIGLSGISVHAYASQIGKIAIQRDYRELDLSDVYASPLRCPDNEIAKAMMQVLDEVAGQGDTVGGIVSCIVRGCPPGLGEPLFGKLQAMLAAAMMSINAAKGFEYGDGFASAEQRGSELYSAPDAANHAGGICGGISNGSDIVMRVAFKPIATLMRPVLAERTDGTVAEFHATGRHDVCAVPRAVAVVEAMACLTLADALLMARCSRV